MSIFFFFASRGYPLVNYGYNLLVLIINLRKHFTILLSSIVLAVTGYSVFHVTLFSSTDSNQGKSELEYCIYLLSNNYVIIIILIMIFFF